GAGNLSIPTGAAGGLLYLGRGGVCARTGRLCRARPAVGCGHRVFPGTARPSGFHLWSASPRGGLIPTGFPLIRAAAGSGHCPSASGELFIAASPVGAGRFFRKLFKTLLACLARRSSDTMSRASDGKRL